MFLENLKLWILNVFSRASLEMSTEQWINLRFLVKLGKLQLNPCFYFDMFTVTQRRLVREFSSGLNVSQMDEKAQKTTAEQEGQ